MRRATGFTLQAVILLYTVPTLVVITGFYAWLVYSHVYEMILEGFDRKLYAASTTTASFIDGDEHNRILTDYKAGDGSKSDERPVINEDTERYRGYAIPMKRVLEKLGLSYHYTVIPKENNFITYVLDATDGEKHSVAGSEEENPSAETQRLLEVMRTGRASLSGIQELDVWGLLKVGTAPIFNKDGEVKALVGADVDISVMNKKTREALFLVFSLGAASLVFAVFVSFIVARKLTDPIRLIKEAALRVAAGKFGNAILIQGPQELTELAQTFNEAAEKLKESVERLEQANQVSGAAAQRSQLIQLFHNGIRQPKPQSIVTVGSALSHLYPAFGWLDEEHVFLLWLASDGEDCLINAKLKSDVKVLASKLINKYADDQELLVEQLAGIPQEGIELLLLLDKRQGTVCAPVLKSQYSGLISHMNVQKSFEMLEIESLSLPVGSIITFFRENLPHLESRAPENSITFVHGGPQ